MYICKQNEPNGQNEQKWLQDLIVQFSVKLKFEDMT